MPSLITSTSMVAGRGVAWEGVAEEGWGRGVACKRSTLSTSILSLCYIRVRGVTGEGVVGVAGDCRCVVLLPAQQFQELEEQRVAFLRHTLWSYCNLLSQSTINIDEVTPRPPHSHPHSLHTHTLTPHSLTPQPSLCTHTSHPHPPLQTHTSHPHSTLTPHPSHPHSTLTPHTLTPSLCTHLRM